jgi:predicted Ser/Thr protein kinase
VQGGDAAPEPPFHAMTDEPTPDDLGAEHLREAAKRTDDLDSLKARLQQQLPSYELQECLGRGGMGVVFLAHQSRLDRQVAIKVLLPPPQPIDGWEERFLREAKALAKLTHPGIVAVHDFDQQEDLAWIVMEFVDGSNLRQLMEGGKLDPSEALAIVPQICAALQYAHDQGIVHRDIKPENILLDEAGAVKIADFGLAKLMDTETLARLTASDQAMGTLRYMAPEQLSSPTKVDHRADIFSLGVVLYEMLTGGVPQGVVRPPSEKVQVDVRLDEVVLKSMQEEPERRYQHVVEVKSSLEEISSTAVPAGGASPHPVAITTEAPSRSGGATIMAKLGDVFAPIAAGFAYTGLVGSVGGDSDGLTVLPELALVSFFLSLWLLLWAPLVGCLTGRIQSGSPGLSAVRLVSGAINFVAVACWRIATFTTEGSWESVAAHAQHEKEQMMTNAIFGFCLICCGALAASGAIGLIASWTFRPFIKLAGPARSRLERAAIWMSIPCLLTLFTNWEYGSASRGWETGPGVVYGILALAILLVGWVSGGRRIRMGGAVAIAMLALAGVIAALSSGFSGSPEPRGWVMAVALSVIQVLLVGVLAVSRTPPEEG